ncbi:MAG: glycine zipper domain-containing protein [Bacteriovoracaceae bacterium]
MAQDKNDSKVSPSYLDDVQIDDFKNSVKEKLTDSKDALTDYVKKNPLTSVAIAAGVGYVLARLLHGRKK